MNTKQSKYDIAYLKMAHEWAKLSHCERKQVGALIVKGRMIISDGFNGTPSGFTNACEDDEMPSVQGIGSILTEEALESSR